MVKPIVLAMIVCDHYYRDSASGKGIISGTFNSVNSINYPSKHGNCAVYIAMTDVGLEGELQLVFRKSDEDGFSMTLPPWKIKPPEDRRAVLEIGGNINGLLLPEEGDYEFVLFFNNSEIASRRLRANKIEIKESSIPEKPEEF